MSKFLKVPEEFHKPDVPSHKIKVWLGLMSTVDYYTLEGYSSLRTLAKKIGLTRVTVTKYFKEFEKEGRLRKINILKNSKRRNGYILTFEPNKFDYEIQAVDGYNESESGVAVKPI